MQRTVMEGLAPSNQSATSSQLRPTPNPPALLPAQSIVRKVSNVRHTEYSPDKMKSEAEERP